MAGGPEAAAVASGPSCVKTRTGRPMPSITDPSRRSATAFALARALGSPSDWPPDLPDRLRDGFATFDPPLPGLAALLADGIEAVQQAPARQEAALVRHTRLFVGPFRPEVDPVASAYLERSADAPAAVVLAAQGAYAEAGLAPLAVHIPPDHIVAELEFLCHLAWQEAETGDAIWRERQVRFWQTSLAPWIGRFADRLAGAAGDDPVYGVVARLLVAATPILDPTCDQSSRPTEKSIA